MEYDIFSPLLTVAVGSTYDQDLASAVRKQGIRRELGKA
jgi:hypothetical protein